MQQGQRTEPGVVATALALRESGYSLGEVARAVGCSEATVMRYEARQVAIARGDTIPALVAAIKGTLAREFARVGLDALAGITPEDWAKASPAQRVTGAAIATDKILALSGSVGGGELEEGNRLAALATTPEGRELLASIGAVLCRVMELQQEGGRAPLQTVAVDAQDGPGGERTQGRGQKEGK